MARTKGSYSLSANIEINAAAPLDARERVVTLADLTAEGSFPYHYVGMETYVVATGKKYRLTGSDPTVSANWSEIEEGGGSGSGGHTIEDGTGTDMTARDNLQFKGAASVSDDSTNNRTIVDVPIMSSDDMSEIISPLPTPPAPDDLDDLGDVTITTPANGQVLKYNSSSSKWENANESGGGSTVSITPALQSGTKVADYEIDGTPGSLYAPTPTDVTANPSGSATSDLTKLQVGSTIYGIPDEDTDALADLTDVAISSATNGQVLKYNSTSSKWENADESGGTGGHVIEDGTGTDMIERSNLQFKGAAQVSDDSTNDRTVVDVPIMSSFDMSEIISPLPTPSTGTTVVPNPSEPATASLTKLQVGDTVYSVSGGSGSTVYGFRISDSESVPSSKVTYLADAVGMQPASMNYSTGKFDYGSWDNAFFMPRPCMLKYDGTVDYYLDPNDYTKKEDGTASDVANTSYAGNAMMEWGQNGKKIWLKIVPDYSNSSSANIYIADHKADDQFFDYAFHNCNGQSVNHFYTSIYDGSVINGKMRSISGVSISKSIGAQDQINYSKANNTDSNVEIWNIERKCDIDLINMLLVLICKSTDTQTSFGKGLGSNGSETIVSNFTTGIHNTRGLFYGTNSDSSSTYSNAVKVFGMENWWGLTWRRYLGHVMINGIQKIKLTYGQEDGSTVTGYNLTGENYIIATSESPSGTSGDYITKHKFTSNSLFPISVSGGSSTNYCDALWYDTTKNTVAGHGGASTDNDGRCGAFFISINSAADRQHWIIGAALSAKPLS